MATAARNKQCNHVALNSWGLLTIVFTAPSQKAITQQWHPSLNSLPLHFAFCHFASATGPGLLQTDIQLRAAHIEEEK